MIVIFALLAAAQAAAPAHAARVCSPAVYTALTAPKSAGEKPYRLSCSVTLKKGDSIPRRLQLLGTSASGVTIDCNGGAIGYVGILKPLAAGEVRKTFVPTVAILSQQGGPQGWRVPADISIQRCHIFGTVRTHGMGSEPGKTILRAASHRRDFTTLVQRSAPRRITIRNSEFTAYRHVPLYIGAGTRNMLLTGSRFTGEGEAAIYLDMESSGNRIENNVFAMKHSREMVAIDGSARNIITGNRFSLSPGKDGIHLYRNCGESAVVRHQTPSDNRIEGNIFTVAGGGRTVVENSRSSEGKKRGYCGLDVGFPFGSSADDNDNATGNKIIENRVIRN